jgi:branched-chain amino acid transport system ATP-binding protein
MKLRVEGVVAGYGVVDVLRGIDLDVDSGSMVTVLGHNGAGKSTLLRAISGLLRVRKGAVWLDDREVTNGRTDHLVRLGLVHCPVGRRLFPRSTVAYNLTMGAFTRRDRRMVHRDLGEVYERFPMLGTIQHEKAGTLSGGQQQLVAIGRALMSRPKVLLLDEPSMGLAPRAAQEVFKHVAQLRDQGLAILMAEQSVRRSLAISDTAAVIEGGRVILQDSSTALLDSEEIQAAFLGGSPPSREPRSLPIDN